MGSYKAGILVESGNGLRPDICMLYCLYRNSGIKTTILISFTRGTIRRESITGPNLKKIVNCASEENRPKLKMEYSFNLNY